MESHLPNLDRATVDDFGREWRRFDQRSVSSDSRPDLQVFPQCRSLDLRSIFDRPPLKSHAIAIAADVKANHARTKRLVQYLGIGRVCTATLTCDPIGRSYPASRVRLSSVCRIELSPEIATASGEPCCLGLTDDVVDPRPQLEIRVIQFVFRRQAGYRRRAAQAPS
jgi:hypothetical protein